MSGNDFERLAGVLYERVRLPGSMKWDRVCMELPHLAADYRAGLLAVLREMLGMAHSGKSRAMVADLIAQAPSEREAAE